MFFFCEFLLSAALTHENVWLYKAKVKSQEKKSHLLTLDDISILLNCKNQSTFIPNLNFSIIHCQLVSLLGKKN